MKLVDEIERLEEILDQMNELMHEAKGLFRGTGITEARFKAYPYGNIMQALGSGEFPRQSLNFRSCIDELRDKDLTD
jgi:hypothetical protein